MAKKVKAVSFGAKLRKLREGAGLSVEELAGRVGMRASRLKKLEADEELAPVAEILRLARTLSVEPSAFMGEGKAKVSPGRRRKALSTRTDDYAYETLCDEEHDKHLMPFRVTIDPKSKHKQVGYSHDGEEFIYVISGRLKISVGRKTKTLAAGESILFDSSKKHRLSNPGRRPTVLVVVLFAP